MPKLKWTPGRPSSALGGLLLVLVAVVVITARPGDRRLYPVLAGAPATTVFLIDNGFHSDLVVPRAAFGGGSRVAREAVAATTDKPWIVIGWGDARFYTEDGFSSARVADALRSLFAPGNPSVVRLEGLPRAPDQIWRKGVRPIQLSSAGLQRMLAHIDQSLAMDGDGHPAPALGATVDDVRFFRSIESFSLIHLCNHWTALNLNAAGLPVAPVIDTIPAGLVFDLKARAGLR
jgi:uncharacterized protein (TIGR02117 family)